MDVRRLLTLVAEEENAEPRTPQDGCHARSSATAARSCVPRALTRDPRFHNVERNPARLDFVAELTPEEAQELDAHFAPRVPDHQADDAAKLTAQLGASRKVTVRVYEWESGL